jgi:amino acid transporter
VVHGAEGDVAEQPELAALPELPRWVTAIWPVLGFGTLGWFAAFCVLLTANEPAWLWTSLAGWVLGVIGFAISAWQRAASRRGSRWAQHGL